MPGAPEQNGARITMTLLPNLTPAKRERKINSGKLARSVPDPKQAKASQVENAKDLCLYLLRQIQTVSIFFFLKLSHWLTLQLSATGFSIPLRCRISCPILPGSTVFPAACFPSGISQASRKEQPYISVSADPPKNRNDWRNSEGAWKKEEAQSKILKKGLTILSKPACSWGV